LDVRIITIKDPQYPFLLSEIPDAPIILFICGDFHPEEYRCLSIVGSRRTSVYGQNTAFQFANQLSEKGFTIVSGLARGIDTAAHKGALMSKQPTIAVLGCGLNRMYPPENASLFDQIKACGAIISEFPMQTPPLPYNFPRRNRIISGLSLGVIVVEAAQKSGALITADFALEQGREVFAIPGQINNPLSHGTHQLIKQGANVATHIQDIMDIIDPCIDRKESKQLTFELEACRKDKNISLSHEESSILEFVSDRPVHIDDLIKSTSMRTSAAGSVLLELEMKKLIKQLPGKRYVR